MAYSAWVLIALPIVLTLFMFFYRRDYLALLFTHPVAAGADADVVPAGLLGRRMSTLGRAATGSRFLARLRRRLDLAGGRSRTLPDILDTLTVSVEAGLGFDAALGQITRYGRGPLAGEFARELQEMRIGRSREDPVSADLLPFPGDLLS